MSKGVKIIKGNPQRQLTQSSGSSLTLDVGKSSVARAVCASSWTRIYLQCINCLFGVCFMWRDTLVSRRALSCLNLIWQLC